MKRLIIISFVLLGSIFQSCAKTNAEPVIPIVTPNDPDFIFGADLSYVNQLADFGGVFKDNGVGQTAYKIFKDHGHNTVRLRIWHNPQWTKTIYGASGKQLYNDLYDVEKAILLSKQQGLSVELDFHYSDAWADPGKQEPPAAWKAIKDIQVLKDSVYNYTFNTLKYLSDKGLMPEYVQLGNETNCGLFYTKTVAGFPTCNACNGQWENLGLILNAGIKAVRDVAAQSPVKTKILLHVADPKNVEWWFDNIKSQAKVTDFDMLGFSYYPIWHTTVSMAQLADKIQYFKTRYNKDIVILETAYPWTETAFDGYANAFGTGSSIMGYKASQQAQYDILKDITQAVIKGGGKGVFYWEPAWISVPAIKDLWGTGSSWENATFFDFNGNALKALDYPGFNYTW